MISLTAKKPTNLTVNTTQRNLLSPTLSPVPGCMQSPTPSTMESDEDSIGSPELGWDPALDAESDLLPSQIRSLRWATSTVDFSDLDFNGCGGEADELTYQQMAAIRSATSSVQISPLALNFGVPLFTVDSSNDLDLTADQTARIRHATSEIDLVLDF